MFKKVLVGVALTISAMAASAQTVIGVMPTEGGKLLFTAEKCSGENNGFIAMLVTKTGKTLGACWGPVGDMVIVKYNDGDLYAYPMDGIEVPAQSQPEKPKTKM